MNQITRSTCPYCGTGCGVLIEHDGRRIIGIAGDPAHPANFGRLCTKGSTLHLSTVQATRLLYPEQRLSRDALGQRQESRRIDWDEALDAAAERFAAIIEAHGPDAVAFYVSGQMLTEDYFVFNKLARALVGTNNIDSNSRLCMSSAVSAYKRTLGADAPPCSYEDIDVADLVLVAGANPAFAHPILFRRLLDARAANPARKLIVVDPRRTETAAEADLHLAIEPGTDTLLYGAMLHVMLWEGAVDQAFIAAHTSDFAAARDAVRDLTPAVAARLCGVKAEDISTAARWFGAADKVLSLWCQGLNQSQHGSDNGAALIHLHLASGQIGRPGCGPFSLTGQPNAMGGRETGTMASLLPGHRDPDSAADCAEVAAFWGIPALPAGSGRTATEIVDGLGDGSIKAVWIACTNPAQSLPDQKRVRQALGRAEFVVVQEAYGDTETCAYADLLLPASTWGEKEGSVTNSERRISRVRAAVPAPGEARPDWQIARDFARRLGVRLGRAEAKRLFAFAGPAEIFAEHAALTAGRDLDFAALDYPTLERDGPQQWPYSAAGGTARLYGDGVFPTADGKAQFVLLSFAATAEASNARFPLHLNTGRLRDQWHGMSRTGKVARLSNHVEQCTLGMHPGDLSRRGLVDGDLVQIVSKQGEIVLPVAADPDLKPSHVWIPEHWGSRRLSHAGCNALLAAHVDPYSKQPELKHVPVRVGKAELPWRGLAFLLADDAEQAAAIESRLAASLPHFAYGALTLSGRERPLIALRLAHTGQPASELLADIEQILGLDHLDVLHYEDVRGIRKRARLAAAGAGSSIAALSLFGETAAGDWLRAAMQAATDAQAFRRFLFAPLAKSPVQQVARGRIVCNCLDVSENEITAAVHGGAGDLAGLQAKLKCGTSCGGCLPELRRLIEEKQLLS